MSTLLFVLFAALGCTGGETPAPTPETPATTPAPPAPEAKVPETPATTPKMDAERLELAISVAKAIKAEPDSAEAILKEKGLSQADLEALMYEVSLDPEAAALYTERTRS
ncbi:MAG: hypothetical protein VX899_22825 [Myxococcota bacterium]|nr:hypothetical protein [Myxococcota bacterium]